MKNKITAVFCTLILFSICLGSIAIAQDFPITDFDTYVNNAIIEFNVAGMAIAVVKDGKIVYANGFGYKNIDKKTMVDKHTLFAIGSTSKAFTAALMGMLVDEEKLTFDDKVTQYYPEFQLYDPYVTREFTIRDLMSHRSGLSRGDRLWSGSSYSREEIIYRIRFLEPSWSFRSHYGYQNIMFLVAGQLIARVTGKSWDDNIKERIFDPLGMNDSNTSINEFQPDDNVATPHQRSRDELRTIPWRDIDTIGPAGSINSSVFDMTQWIRLQLGQGTLDGKKFWSMKVQNEMHSPNTITGGLRKGLTHFTLYGLGWSLRDYRGRFVASHGGGIDGMNASVGLMPEENIGIVQLSNVNGNPIMSTIMNRVFDAYLDVPEDEWSDLSSVRSRMGRQGRAQDNLPEPPENTSPSLPLERYVNEFIHDMYGKAKIEVKNGRLYLSFQAYPATFLEHKHLDTFRTSFQTHLLSDVDVSFTISSSAEVIGMNIPGFGTFQRLER